MIRPPSRNFFKHNIFQNMLLTWVNAVRYTLPSISVEKAVSQFYKYYGIEEQEFMKQESACRIYYRIDEELKLLNQQANARKKDQQAAEKKQ